MADFKRIKISDIAIPDRLRAIEEAHALAIAQSIVEHGLLNPITVRATPAAKDGSFTLVAGAHRLRATEINRDSEIDAIVVTADKTEAQLLEITENLFRNELSVIDRAVFVSTYRQVWEQKYGKIEAGRPGNRANLAQLFDDQPEGSFASHVADRMGLSKRAVQRLTQIVENLHPDVRNAVRGTTIADNQSQLLKLSKMAPKLQRKAAVALKGNGSDLKQALALVEGPRPKPDAQEALFGILVDAWARANEGTRARFVAEIAPKEVAA